ncbi:LysR family transcriptional regulator [Pandoraea cepalis]|uniref:LysR family transcriptional regulator n=2 Tax=Pandoraea TaxID=93217 RepID=A0AAW7MKN0_9BURK|nr:MULTISPECIES: LysR family transcriptional regulator [Pandoraea]MDN4573384.1 LysR family transcriptional regulator [Pandoraea cepalis]MDN4577662.1 LysR family transcriptional regulator [Pandoraea cepalis]VVE07535.1 transcriptional regulator [Pandoraea soli]
MKHATLRQLKVFEAVARHLSFSRAAEELHLTQPAVSTQVKQLESHVGLPLFEQLGKKVFLTPAGAEMLHYSRAIIALFRETEEAMDHLKGITGGKLNVAVISAGDYFFPRLLAAFTARHPGVTLNLTVHNREELLHQLTENLTDLAVMVRPPPEIDTINEAFAPHPYVIVAPPDHPLASQRQIPFSRLTEEPFISRERGSDTWNSLQDAFGQRTQRLKITMEIASTETIKQAVVAGMGISFLSAHTVGMELQTGQLTVLDVQGFPAWQSWYVVHRRSKRLPPVALAFREFLLAEGAALIDGMMAYKSPVPPPAARGGDHAAARRTDPGSAE